jgi:hypothetical protein
MITEDYVSFETAKLLKEKGFDEATFYDYNERGTRWFEEVLVNHNSQGGVACPTLQMAMKWLREIHNLEIYPYHNNSTIYNSKWWFEIIEYPNSVAEYESGKNEEFDTYEEACEAAIKYCLENLI